MKELKTLEIKVTAVFGVFEEDHLVETVPVEVKVTRLDADLFEQAYEAISKRRKELKQLVVDRKEQNDDN